MNYDNLIVALMTSTDKDYPTRIKFAKDSFVALDQIRTISVRRVVKKLNMKVTSKNIKEVKSIIKMMLLD